MILIYTTCKNIEEAKTIAKALLDKKLIACANMLETKSLYNWKGKFCDESEILLLMKTTNDKFGKIKEKITSLHSYELPAIIKLTAESTKEFEKWVSDEVK